MTPEQLLEIIKHNKRLLMIDTSDSLGPHFADLLDKNGIQVRRVKTGEYLPKRRSSGAFL